MLQPLKTTLFHLHACQRNAVKDTGNVKLRVNKAYKASFDYVVFKKGDKVKVGREDPKMPGWYWCEDKDGVWSWIPEEYLDRDGTEGTITHYACMHILTSILRSHRFVIFSSPMCSTIIHNRQKVHFRLLLCEIESEIMPRDHICGACLANS